MLSQAVGLADDLPQSISHTCSVLLCAAGAAVLARLLESHSRVTGRCSLGDSRGAGREA